jgi:alkylation response protein AidB-like acyl-CoA dehydrogenase
MMDFELSEEQRLVRETFARFADEKVKPKAAEIDAAKEFPRELFKELARLGLFGLRYPESVGGSGMDFICLCLAMIELARGSLSLAACAAMQSLMGTHFLFAFGNEDIHHRLLRPALEGNKVGTICITEPNAGSDLSAIATIAKKVEGGYRLNGQKMWTTSAPVADFHTVFARTGDERQLSIFLVEKDSEGLSVGRTIDKMGVWALPTSELSLSDCFVPQTHRLGQEGEGETELRKILDEIRIVTAALALGVAGAAVEDSVRYSKERIQFGRPISRFQAIQLKLAEMGADLEAARYLVYYAAWLIANNRPSRRLASVAKLFATEAATAICDKASRIFASYGFAMEYPIQRYLRDVRFTLFGGGTSEINKLIIAREMTG